ncbi:unnamed protein product [Mytilus coruscus]|uniref:Wiskott-Aldrich syndrome protein family member n=1 Tax=Mytilus coruscus TaxID=42192 RepID=A0A6J7ZWY1_MYTCO|nr:unnamed protein product [Mytilus coruscus]
MHTPPPPPVPVLPSQPNRWVTNNTPTTTESLSVAGVFTENSLLASIDVKSFCVMPFIQRKTVPVRLSQVQLTKDVAIGDELDCIANHTLCGIIQQISSLSHNATDMFEDLLTETMNVITRSNKLKNKVSEMKEKCKMREKEETGGSLHAVNIENEKALSQHFDQQILSLESRSNAIRTIYEAANPPPAITKMNQFRENGTNGLKLYTDPTFFFMHWFSQMQKKEPDNREHKIKRAERKTRRQNGSGPRQIKRTRDIMKEKAKREEFSSKGVQPSHGKCKKNKKKNMEGFSNTQWEERHPDQVPANAREKDAKENNGTEHDNVQNETSISEPLSINDNEDVTTPPVPLRKHNETCHNTQSVLPAPPDERYSQLPPPPPDDRYSQLPPPPPTPPPILTDNDPQIYPRNSVAPHDFYQNDKENSMMGDRDSMFPLPPPPDLLELGNDEEMDSFMEPPPPLEITSNMIRPSNKLKAKRISTFVMTSGMETCDNIDGRRYTKLIDYPGICNAPPPPPPPPVPGLPPQPNGSVTNNAPTTTESLPPAGVFTENSLLAIKKNLKQAKERKTPAQTMKTQTNQLDVNTIMNRALEGHRKFIEDSSSDEDDSDFSDSDSDWD